MDIQRNPTLDPLVLAREYANDQRVQIRDFLVPDSAQYVYGALRDLPWNLVYRDGANVVQLPPERLGALTQQDAARIRQTVDKGARSGFQFLYNSFPILERYFDAQRKEHAIFRAFEFLNSPEMLALLRTVTGLENTRWLDAQGALYQASHFLKYHTDESAEEPRLAAYVLSFAENWDVDWGGLLQFWNDEDDIEFALRPRFNALNLFAVPRRHSVSAVASWSPGLRFSITGWLRADDPPVPLPWRP